MFNIFTVYDAIDKFNKLDKNTKKIMGLLLIIVLLLIATNILKNKLEEKPEWEYSKTFKVDSIEDIVSSSKKTNNRKRYWELTSIIDTYVSSILVDEDMNKEFEYSYEDYYKLLTKEYKRGLNKKEYNELARDFVYRFAYETNDKNGTYKKVEYSIKDVYLYDNDMYLCYISVDDNEMSDIMRNAYYLNNSEDVVREIKTDGYIGIKLNQNNGTYKIFYLE